MTGKNGRVFWKWFAVGAVIAVSNTSFVLDSLPFLSPVMGVLSSPGVIVSLPVLNLVASPWWAVGSICILNGAAYGFGALAIAHMMRRCRSPE